MDNAIRNHSGQKKERRLDASIAHLESVHRVVMQKQTYCKVIPFPPRRSSCK